MQWRNTEQVYGGLSIALHWGMLALLIAVVGLMELKGIFPKGSASRAAMKAWHYSLGILVLVLTIPRLAALLCGPAPRIVPSPPGWQLGAANMVKLGLYALMVGMPLVGWALLNAGGDSLNFFGWQLPALVSADEALAENLEEIHEAGASAGYVLVGLHVAGALFHHYFLRDNTLRRMFPRRHQ